MGYQLEIRHIKYFLAVAEDLHFRKAAEKLNISQPALSKQIKELEDHTGIQLFKRNNRNLVYRICRECVFFDKCVMPFF